MIDRLKDIIAKAKYLTLTIADQGDQVQITATVRPKDGADPAKPIQVKADWQIADALLVEALHKPPKAGKTEVKKPEKKAEEEAGDLFAAAEPANSTGNADTQMDTDNHGPTRTGAGTGAETREDRESADGKATGDASGNDGTETIEVKEN